MTTTTTPRVTLLLVRRTHVTDAQVMLALVHEFTDWAGTTRIDDADAAVTAFLAERSSTDGTMAVDSVPCLHRRAARAARMARRCPHCHGTGNRTVELRVHPRCQWAAPAAA